MIRASPSSTWPLPLLKEHQLVKLVEWKPNFEKGNGSKKKKKVIFLAKMERQFAVM